MGEKGKDEGGRLRGDGFWVVGEGRGARKAKYKAYALRAKA